MTEEKLKQLDQEYANVCAAAGDMSIRIRAMKKDLDKTYLIIESIIKEKASMIMEMQEPQQGEPDAIQK